MTVNFKKLLYPLICLVTGLFNFIFMFMNYASLFLKIGGEKETDGFSGYNMMIFGEDSIGDELSILLRAFDEKAHAPFLLSFVSILFIFMTILSILLIVVGVLGFLKELWGIDPLKKVEQRIIDRISKELIRIYFCFNIFAASSLVLSCILNLYTGVYFEDMSLGVQPGIGMFFMLIFAIAAWVVFLQVESRFEFDHDMPIKTVYRCSFCNAKAKATDQFCSRCGSKVVVVEPEKKAEISAQADEATEETVEDSGASEDAPEKPAQPLSNTEQAHEKTVEPLSDTEQTIEKTVEAPADAEKTADENESEQSTEKAAKKFSFAVIANFFKNIYKKVTDKVNEFAESKNIKPKMLYIAAAAALALIIVLIIVLNAVFSDNSEYMTSERSVLTVYDEEAEKTLILVDGKLAKATIDSPVYDYESSLNGKTTVFLDEDDTLYAYYKKTLSVVGYDVDNFKISSNGMGIAYVDDDGNLMLYNVKKERSDRVASDLESAFDEAYFLSPDGKTVAYAEGDYDDIALWTYSAGKSEKIEKNAVPLGLSDDAELIYYFNVKKMALYVKEEDETPQKLASVDVTSYEHGGTPFRIYFNADNTQILFSVAGSGIYISEDGDDREKLTSDSSISRLGGYTLGYSTSYSGISEIAGIYETPIYDFEEQYFTDYAGTLYYIDDDFQAHEVEEDVQTFQRTASGDMMYYLTEDDDLYRGKGYGKKFTRIAGDVDDFEITSDGKGCYFVDFDETLRYVKKTKKAEKIADEVRGLRITYDDYALFYIEESRDEYDLYSSRKGKKMKLVASDVADILVSHTCSYYATEDSEEMSLYGASKKTKFKFILSVED